MADDVIMPPPERAAKTALGTSTVSSYLKADSLLKADIPKGKTLDFGSGKGLGAKAIGADTYEPYVKSEPKYNTTKQIKSNSYDKVTSLNVLNTIEPEGRKEAVKNIGRVLKPNGVAIISTRGKDVEDAKIKTKVRDGYVIGKGEQARFQKGFTQDELKEYAQKTLGNNFKVEKVKGLGKAAIKVKKLNITPTPIHKALSIKGANFPGGRLTKRFNEGGTVMKKQMEMFEDGGLKDEGGMIDEVSGNDVPSGSTREEVRDDIPAQLSEGEFVFPADVVRFIGLEKLMQMRQKAKMGLQKMEDMGQMGNSDEATMPDDLPFDETDLDMEDELEYNRGGVIEAQQGTYVAPTVPTGSQPLGTGPMGNPTQMLPQQVASGVSGASRGTPYVPNVGNMYGAGATPYAPVSYNQLLGPSATGAPTTESVRYFNEATGQVRMIPHLKNADGTRGATLYPVPEGFVIQEEAPKEEAKKTQVQSAKVAPVDTGDGGDPSDDGKGGASLSFGGTKSGAGKGLQSNAITANISYNINPFGVTGVFGSLMTINDINKGKNVNTIGNKNGLTTNPVTMTVGKGKVSLTSKEYATVKNNPTGKEAKDLKNRLEVLNSIVTTPYTFNPVTNVYTDTLGNTLSTEEAEQAGKDVQNNISQEVSKGRDIADVIDDLTQTEVSVAQDYGITAEDEADTDDSQNTGGFDFGATAPNQGSSLGIGKGMGELSDDNNDNDGGFSGDQDTGFGMSDEDAIAKGSLVTKRKASGKLKKKYMKRGGLASR